MEKFKKIFNNKRNIVVGILVICLIAIGYYFWSGRNGRFVRTGDMTISREFHTATLLKDGRVLITGGYSDTLVPPIALGYLNSAEIYNPKTGKFTRTGDMNVARANHTATLLKDGRVLIAGGLNGSESAIKSAEIYNPKTGKFTFTGSMNFARSFHTATLLKDGRVLIVGGTTNMKNMNNIKSRAEIFNFSTGQFTLTPKMLNKLYGNTSILLPNGHVLIIGGIKTKTAQIYDPNTNIFSKTGIISKNLDEFTFANLYSTFLDKRNIFIMVSPDYFYLYNVADNKFNKLQSNIAIKCNETNPCSIVALKNNKILITGMEQKRQLLFDQTKKIFELVPTINRKVNIGMTSTLLKNGNILLTGGLIEYRPSYSIFTMFHRHRKSFKISNRAELFKY